MNFFKKVAALASASVLTGVGVFAGVVGVANAAPVTLVIEPGYLAPGETATITIDGCSIGSSFELTADGDVLDEGTVAADDMPLESDLGYGDFEPGSTVDFSVTCTPAADSDEAASSANDTITVFGASYLEAVPTTFYTGETVSITAGDFLPGSAVTLAVLPSGSEDSVFSKALGTAGEDFSVTGDVVFPEDLECGAYTVEISGGGDVVSAELSICGAPTPEPSASPSPSVSASPSASPSPSVSPSASAQPTATASPTQPTNPGLPSTGN